MTTLPDNTRNQLAKLQDELEGCRQVIADFTRFEGSKITELKKQLDGKQREINELSQEIYDHGELEEYSNGNPYELELCGHIETLQDKVATSVQTIKNRDKRISELQEEHAKSIKAHERVIRELREERERITFLYQKACAPQKQQKWQNLLDVNRRLSDALDEIQGKNSNTNIEMERAIEQKDLAIAQLKTNVNRLTSEHSLLKYFNTKQAESILTLRLERDNNQKAVIIQLNNDNDKIVELTEKLRQADSVIHSLTQKLFTNPLHRSHA